MIDQRTCCVCEKNIADNEVTWAEGDLPYCNDCVERELDECDYCGDLRWTENLFEYGGKMKSRHGEMMCIGCIEKVDDECE